MKIAENSQGFTTIHRGRPYQIEKTHDHYEELLEAARESDVETFMELKDAASKINSVFEDTKLYVENGQIYYGPNSTIPSRAADAILQEKVDPEKWVAFFDRLVENPSNRALENLFEYLQDASIVVSDGYIWSYKAVRSDLYDKHTGTTHQNLVGKTVEMPRNQVDEDPNNHCSAGLHVGASKYAGPDGWFTSRDDVVAYVRVDPVDVVSIPNDHGCRKMRCCRYEVVRLIEPSEVLYTAEIEETVAYDEDLNETTIEGEVDVILENPYVVEQGKWQAVVDAVVKVEPISKGDWVRVTTDRFLDGDVGEGCPMRVISIDGDVEARGDNVTLNLSRDDFERATFQPGDVVRLTLQPTKPHFFQGDAVKVTDVLDDGNIKVACGRSDGDGTFLTISEDYVERA